MMHIFDRVFYYPDEVERGTPADDALAYEDVFFSGDRGARLHGWFLPAVAAKPPHATVLHLHGNAANISGHYEFVRWLPEAGYSVLTFDYQGYGRSEGSPAREATLRDASAALDYVCSRPDVDRRRIVLFGQSIGGAVAAVVAVERREQVRAVAIDSAFSGYRKIARYHVMRNPLLTVLAWWFPYGVAAGWDPVDFVGRISPVPVLFMHGKADRIAPWEMSQELFDAAKEPKELWLIEGMNHTGVWEAEPEIARRRLLAFFDRALTD
jgi:hypothetical protein